MKSKCAVLAIVLAAMVGVAADSGGAARLQALVDAAAAPGGTGVADIPPGVYELERPLVVTNWVSLALHPHAVLRAAADMEFLVLILIAFVNDRSRLTSLEFGFCLTFQNRPPGF